MRAALNTIRQVARSSTSRYISARNSSTTLLRSSSLRYHVYPAIIQRRTFLTSFRTQHPEQDSAPEAQPTSFVDPTRPDVYYHLLNPPTPASSSAPVFAISFLSKAPVVKDSRTTIGWLPATTESAAEGEEDAGLNDFKENVAFLGLLHEAVKVGLADGVDEIQINGAIQLQEGWMHIYDERNIPALGRIGDPDDILASVLVEGGRILPETYQPMPAYRLCTADGLTKLTPGLAARLQDLLQKEAEAEKNLEA